MTMKTTAYTRKITTNGTIRTTKTTGTTRTTEKTRTSRTAGTTRTTETTGTNSTTAATTGTTRATRTTGTKRANVITYTILKDSSTPPPPPQLRAFFTKLNYNNTHYRTSKAQKQHNQYLNLEVNILFEFCYNALIFKILCVINSLKLLVHLITL